jgi:DNA-binding LacI/PurR family transcriptional regulator
MAVEAIRSQIRSGALKPGSSLPPETGLAQSLDLSRGTIRKAIDVLIESGEISRKPYTRPRIEAKRGSAGPIGSMVHVWISHPIADDATLQFLRGISNGLMGTSFRQVVREPSRFFADYVKTEEREFLMELLKDDAASCAIIERDADAGNDDLYRLVAERGKYLVFVDIPPPKGVAADYVGTANLSACRRCTEHLIQLGHSRIVYVSESATPFTVKQRINGYWRALRVAGLEANGRVFLASDLSPAAANRMPSGGNYGRALAPSPYYNERAHRLVRDILDMTPRPTAIVASCDVLALWVCAVLEASGFSIPNDFAVTGFDWLARWGDPAMDLVTTASQDFEGFGYHAAEFLLDHGIEDAETTPRQLLIPAPLVVRSSTASDTGPANVTNAAGNARPRLFRSA